MSESATSVIVDEFRKGERTIDGLWAALKARGYTDLKRETVSSRLAQLRSVQRVMDGNHSKTNGDRITKAILEGDTRSDEELAAHYKTSVAAVLSYRQHIRYLAA